MVLNPNPEFNKKCTPPPAPGPPLTLYFELYICEFLSKVNPIGETRKPLKAAAIYQKRKKCKLKVERIGSLKSIRSLRNPEIKLNK